MLTDFQTAPGDARFHTQERRAGRAEAPLGRPGRDEAETRAIPFASNLVEIDP
jgi:hypothetical protein